MKLEVPDELLSEEARQNTPYRWKKFMLELEAKRKPFNFTTFKNPGIDQIITLTTEFFSLCEHHILPFHGVVHIGYIPNEVICGTSKLARVVDMYASKPQLQEQLTQDITNFLWEHLSPKGVMVVIEAVHDCMRMRGVRKLNSILKTSAIRGTFEKESVKNEFMDLIRGDRSGMV